MSLTNCPIQKKIQLENDWLACARLPLSIAVVSKNLCFWKVCFRIWWLFYEFYNDLVGTHSFKPNCSPHSTWTSSPFTHWGIALCLIELHELDGKMRLRLFVDLWRERAQNCKVGCPSLVDHTPLDIQYHKTNYYLYYITFAQQVIYVNTIYT